MEYSFPCEPYVVALKAAIPRYDERFRGRGYNKVRPAVTYAHLDMRGAGASLAQS